MYIFEPLFLIVAAIADLGLAKQTFEPHDFPASSILHRDVVFVGGGSSGVSA